MTIDNLTITGLIITAGFVAGLIWLARIESGEASRATAE